MADIIADPSSSESIEIISSIASTSEMTTDCAASFTEEEPLMQISEMELNEEIEEFLFEFDDVGCCLDENGHDRRNSINNDIHMERYDDTTEEFFIDNDDENTIEEYVTDDDNDSVGYVYNQDEYEEDDVDDVRILQKGEKFLVYLAVPVLISQLLMLFILISSANASKSLPIIHVHIHEFRHDYYFNNPISTLGSQKASETAGHGFVYYLFNPFAIVFDSKYFIRAVSWISAKAADPECLLGQSLRWFETVRARASGLLEREVSTALEMRNSWNKAVFNQVCRLAESPAYQRTISTISKWSTSIKNYFN